MSLTLKFAALAAVILPFSPRRETMERSPPPALPPPTIDVETVPEEPEDRPPLYTAPVAVNAFVCLMSQEWGGNEFPFSALVKSYAALSYGMRWPAVSDKALSKLMQSAGCVRVQKDLRAKGRGKPVYLIIPMQEAA